MEPQRRMSPLTALFMGVSVIGAVGIASLTTIVLYGMRIVEKNAHRIVEIADKTVDDLPELIEALPPAIQQVLNDRRAPEYTASVDVKVHFVPSQFDSGVIPSLTITNKGSEVITMLGVSVAAVDRTQVPFATWTTVAATPFTLDEDWRGPILPGSTRHVVLACARSLTAKQAEQLAGEVEITELRVWNGTGPMASN